MVPAESEGPAAAPADAEGPRAALVFWRHVGVVGQREARR